MKKIQVEVDVHCEKSQTELLKVVSKLPGIDELTVDKEKGVLTVVGSVDPVCVVKKIRKAKRHAEIISVGPPKKPDDEAGKKNVTESQPDNCPPPSYCHCPPIIAVGYDPCYDPSPCTIV